MQFPTLTIFNQSRRLFTGLVFLIVAILMFSSPVFAEGEQGFISKKYDVKGSWQIVEENGQTLIRFNQNFKTKGGPDLKVFLSPSAIDQVSGKTATDGSVQLGKLQSTSGSQDYILPEGLMLDDYKSVLVHCEQYSVLWGGGDLLAAMGS